MEYKITQEILEKILSKNSRSLVGILCKRVEVLEENKKLSPDLYKSLAKELIYESFRNVLNQIETFNLGVKFITPKKDDN